MTELDAELSGITLHYATWGEPTAGRPAVLLIHGISSNHRAWTAVAPFLARHGFSPVAPDLRGRGQSSKPAHGYSIPQHADDMLSLCDALGLDRFHLVGHSLGAQIALTMAAMHPERIDRLVVVDAGGRFPADTIQAISASLARLDAVHPSLDDYLEAMSRSPFHPWDDFWESYYRYDATAHPAGGVASRVPRTAVDEEIRALDILDLDAVPGMVRAPTLIIPATVGLLGPDRGLVLPLDQAERMAGALSNSRVVPIPQTNHYTILTAPRLREEILSFLS